MVVRIGPVDDPPAGTLAVTGPETPAAVKLRQVGVFGADEMEFAFFRKDRRRAFVVPFEADSAAASETLREARGRQQK